MSRILLTTLGSLGDLHPFIALGLGLQERGHKIVFATANEYRDRVESQGFEFQPIRPDLPVADPQLVEAMMDLQNGTKQVIKDYLLANLRDTYTDLLVAARDVDFIVTHEIVYATPLVAQKLNLPWASCALAPGAFFSAYDPFVLPTFPVLAKLQALGPNVNRLIKELAKFITRDWGEPIRQLRQELGLSPLVGNPVIDAKFSPYLVLALFSTVIGAPQPDWPPQTISTGFPFYDGDRDAKLVPELDRFLAAGEPPIVFTLGSAAIIAPGEFFPVSVAAVQQLKRRAVLLVGENPPPENLPPEIVAFDRAPYSQIFPRAAAIVHQGGIGTTAQALRAGRPTSVMPYSHDQPDNAARVARLGTSRTISRQDYTVNRAVTELRSLLNDPSYAIKAAEIGRIISAEDGVAIACEAILARAAKSMSDY